MEYGAEITIKKNNYYWDTEINSSINRHIQKKIHIHTYVFLHFRWLLQIFGYFSLVGSFKIAKKIKK